MTENLRRQLCLQDQQVVEYSFLLLGIRAKGHAIQNLRTTKAYKTIM